MQLLLISSFHCCNICIQSLQLHRHHYNKFACDLLLTEPYALQIKLSKDWGLQTGQPLACLHIPSQPRQLNLHLPQLQRHLQAARQHSNLHPQLLCMRLATPPRLRNQTPYLRHPVLHNHTAAAQFQMALEALQLIGAAIHRQLSAMHSQHQTVA